MGRLRERRPDEDPGAYARMLVRQKAFIEKRLSALAASAPSSPTPVANTPHTDIIEGLLALETACRRLGERGLLPPELHGQLRSLQLLRNGHPRRPE